MIIHELTNDTFIYYKNKGEKQSRRRQTIRHRVMPRHKHKRDNRQALVEAVEAASTPEASEGQAKQAAEDSQIARRGWINGVPAK